MSKPEPSSGLGDFIRANIEPILQEWETFARSLVPLAGLDRKALRDHAQAMLMAVVDDMDTPQSERERAAKAKGLRPGNTPELSEAAELHAGVRFDDLFTLDQLVAEFRAIRASVLRQWASSRPSADAAVEDLTRFNEAIDQALIISITRYSTRLDESRAIILGVLAHDLRNPLHVVSIGMHYILRSDASDAASMKVAARALRSVERMDGLIRDLLDFTLLRLGTGLPVTVEPANMGQLCRATVDEVEASHPGRRIRCEISGEADGEWDPKRVSQMLVNLLTNALHHGDPNADVAFTLTSSDTEVCLEVHNEGPAIPTSIRAQLFQPLLRDAPDQRSGASQSSGLGLGVYIACQIATAHGGSLKLRSTDAEGTTFTVTLPRHHEAQPR